MMLMLAAAAWGQPAAAQPAEPAAPQIDPKAEEVLRAMSKFYRGLDGLSVDAHVTMSRKFQGQQQSASADVSYAMQRPNKFSMTPAQTLPGARLGIVKSDGQTLHVYVPSLSKYTANPAPANLDPIVEDRTLDVISASTGSAVGALLVDDPYAGIMADVETAKYIGLEKDGDDEHHRIRLSSQHVSNDLWIAAGDKPLLVKIVPDFSATIASAKAAGQELEVEMVLKLDNWETSPEFGEDAFRFDPPAGSQKVASFFEQPKHALEGKPAPDFTLAALDGNEVKLSSHKGKDIVILDFWATWCGPCVQAMPILTAVAEQYKDKGVVLYGVNQREGAEMIQRFLDQRKLKLNVLLDMEGAVAQQYGVRGIPQTVIVDGQGNVAAVHVGFSPALRQQLTEELEKLLKPPAEAAPPEVR